MFKTLIDPSTLAPHLADPNWAVIDCRFDLTNPDKGEEQYREGHIPGARYAHLDRHLSGPKTGKNGRHPLPDSEKIIRNFSDLGISPGMQVVAYDGDSGMYAARLWWMLRWLGHDSVAVLDGGLQAWEAAGGAVTNREEPSHFQSNFVTGEPLMRLVDTKTVATRLAQADQTLIDARAPQRYRGEVEPLDPIAGHIPGALNRPFSENLGPDGKFKPAAQLRAEFESLLAGREPSTVVHQCGSGVSAVPNLLAMQVAGLGPTALYAGSWSEWSNTPGLPTRQGAEP